MSLVLQTTLAVVFIISGTYKARHPIAAATSATRFGLSVRPTRTTGYVLAVAELTVAAALLVPIRDVALVGLGASALLSLTFTVLTARAVAHRDFFDCSCLGNERLSRSSIARAAAMLGASVLAAVGVASNGPRAVNLETASTAVGMALVIVCLPYAARLASRVRGLRSDFEQRADWNWMIQELTIRRGGQI